MKRDRSSLKLFFSTNNIPTQDNFSDLIESGFNQVEDGIEKKAGSPISIQAEGVGEGTQDLLFFYKSLKDDNPTWKISQSPRIDPKDPATNKLGFNISDAANNSRLFIKSEDGNIGIGTITPLARLHIKQGNLAVENGNLGIGIAEPETKLHIKTKGAELRLENNDANDWSFVSVRGPASNFWNIGQKGDSDRLEFRPNGGEPNKLSMISDGSLLAPGGVIVEGNRSTHLANDGAMYRYSGQVYLNVDDNLYIKDVRSDTPKIHFDTLNARIGVGKLAPSMAVDVAGDVKANNFFGEGSSKIEWTLGFADKVASGGNWFASQGWGEPKFSASCAYSATDGITTDAAEYLDFNIPAGAKTAYISALAWLNTAYFDVFVKIAGIWKFQRRVNQYNAVSNNGDAGNHDGNYVTLIAAGVDHASQIRIQVRKGRLHFTGLGFTRSDMAGSYDPGFVHQDNIFAPHIVRGMIIMYTGSAAPLGWALCDGTNGTPDLRGRFVLGYGQGSGLSYRPLNQVSGFETHTLSVNEMPSHSHLIYTYQDDWNVSGGSGRPSWGADNGAYGAFHNTAATGGGAAHNNMPPYWALAFIMKL